jgi:hypothetical protein
MMFFVAGKTPSYTLHAILKGLLNGSILRLMNMLREGL